MGRGLALLFAMLALFSIAPQSAQAGVPIPCTGEHVVTVVETPQSMKNFKGVHINVGYLFQGCTGGKWVGYSGSGSSYYNLPEPALRMLLASAGRKDFPSPPSFLLTPSASWTAWLWIVIIAIALVATALSKLAAMNSGAEEALEMPGEPHREAAAAPASPPQSAARDADVAPRRVSVPNARPAFGRRG